MGKHLHHKYRYFMVSSMEYQRQVFPRMCLKFFGSLKLEAIPPIHGIYTDILNRTYINNDVCIHIIWLGKPCGNRNPRRKTN